MVRISSMELILRGGRHYVQVKCSTCGAEKQIELHSLKRGMTKGCQACSQPRTIPRWLERRLTAMKQRCTNPNDKAFKNYGGRGIEFRFESVTSAGLWIMENLGLRKDLELDRIDNNGHYSPGNIRWASDQLQTANRRTSTSRTTAFFELRVKYPEVRYADNTLRNMLKTLTVDQIVDRWHNGKSCKPKGVYGTCSTPAHDIVSLLKDG